MLMLPPRRAQGSHMRSSPFPSLIAPLAMGCVADYNHTYIMFLRLGLYALERAQYSAPRRARRGAEKPERPTISKMAIMCPFVAGTTDTSYADLVCTRMFEVIYTLRMMP